LIDGVYLSYGYGYDEYGAYGKRCRYSGCDGKSLVKLTSLCPVLWSQLPDIPVGGMRETGENIAEIVIGINAPTAATFDNPTISLASVPSICLVLLFYATCTLEPHP
jgi:hypothetical protein